ncbi:MAG: hypothetical protein WAT22_03610 [Saprospiraceae bacterium]
MLTKSAFFSGFNNPSTVPAGNFSKAALVGAKTVNGPALESASTYPPALTAATKVVWSLLPTATCTMLGLETSSFTLDWPTPSAAAVTSDDAGADDSEVDDLHDKKANTIITRKV